MRFEDHIFHTGDRWSLPHVAASVPGFVKHVHCDGARDHVLSVEGWQARVRPFETFGVDHCSVKNCIVNLDRAERLVEHGFDWPEGTPRPAESGLRDETGHGDD